MDEAILRLREEKEMSSLLNMGIKAKDASVVLSRLTASEKNNGLFAASEALLSNMELVLSANREDVEEAIKNGIKGALIDRLTLDKSRVEAMAEGLRQVAALPDPIGEILQMKTMDSGLTIGQKRVPMGVIGIIFEARPNVTADAFGLCLKAGSATILRGGKEARRSNQTIVSVFQLALSKLGLPAETVQIVEDQSHETAREMMRMNAYIDVLIPRGGAGLIRTVVENSTVPVIETGVGNCHIFVDESANLENAVEIVINAKTQRPGVCNACESLLVHDSVADKFLPMIGEALKEKNVEIRGDETVVKDIPDAILANEEDWGKEFLDFVISARVVKNVDEAIEHIRRYGTGHSEAILTESYANSQKFLNEVDAAAVYVNASTRFTDGSEFGFGAEIGISTQKLHARGPMGLKELTTTKYIIFGSGQIRK